MNHPIRTLLIASLITLIATMAYLYYDNTQNIARCQNAGGAWDTTAQVCDMSAPEEVPKAP
jgi:hypothetical protein